MTKEPDRGSDEQDADRFATPEHPLVAQLPALNTAIVDAIRAASGITRPPRTLAEFDQVTKAADDTEAVLRGLVDAEREEAAFAVQESMKW